MRPVTIGNLKREGKLLEIECSSCHRLLYKSLLGSFRDAEPVPGLVRQLECSKCGARKYRRLVSDPLPA